jgi:hypothetical protein
VAGLPKSGIFSSRFENIRDEIEQYRHKNAKRAEHIEAEKWIDSGASLHVSTPLT